MTCCAVCTSTVSTNYQHYAYYYSLMLWRAYYAGIRESILSFTAEYTTRKIVPIAGRAGTFLEFLKLQSQSKLNPNQVQSIFFALVSSSVSKANLSCVVATIFSSLAFFFRPSPWPTCRLVATIFSSLAFISSSVYMAKLNRLIAASFSSLAHLFFFHPALAWTGKKTLT